MTDLLQAARKLGETGSPPIESERLAFEEWMAGHCWGLSAHWDGKQYVSDAEQGGWPDPRAMMTRRLWAAWRDRAALAAHAAPGVALSDEQIMALPYPQVKMTDWGVYRVTDEDAIAFAREVLAAAGIGDAPTAAQPVAHTAERHFALRDAHGNADEEAYFKPRPQIDTQDRRRVFRAGHERGFDAGEKVYAAPLVAAQPATPLRRGVNGVCTRSICECERQGLGDQCVWLSAAQADTQGGE